MGQGFVTICPGDKILTKDSDNLPHLQNYFHDFFKPEGSCKNYHEIEPQVSEILQY